MIDEQLAALFVEIQFKFDLPAIKNQLQDVFNSLQASVRPIEIPVVYKPTNLPVGERPPALTPGQSRRQAELDANAALRLREREAQSDARIAVINREADSRIRIAQSKAEAQEQRNTAQISISQERLKRAQDVGTGAAAGSALAGHGLIHGAVQIGALMEGIEIARSSLEYNSALASLQPITKNKAQFEEIKRFISDISFKAGTPITDIAEHIRPSLMSVMRMGGSLQDAEKYFTAMSYASSGLKGNVVNAVWGDALREFLDGNKIQLSRISRSDLQGQLGFVQSLQRLPEFKGLGEKKIETRLDAMNISQRIEVLVETLQQFTAAGQKTESMNKSFTQLNNSFIELGSSLVQLIDAGGLAHKTISELAQVFHAMAVMMPIFASAVPNAGKFIAEALAHPHAAMGVIKKQLTQTTSGEAVNWGTSSDIPGLVKAKSFFRGFEFSHGTGRSSPNPVTITIHNKNNSVVNVAKQTNSQVKVSHR